MNWTDLPKDRQVELLHLLENRTGLNAKSIEKDWWVTLALFGVASRYAEAKTSLLACKKQKQELLF